MSEKVSITKSKLDSLANAIAAVGGTSIPKTISQMESAVLELTIPPNLETITIKPDNCVSSSTQITPETYVCETDSSYPGTIISMSNQSVCIIGNYLDSNIKIELNKAYHCVGQLFIKWDNDDTEEYYYIDSDFNVSAYSGTITLPSFTWEGSTGAIQTFNSMQLAINQTPYGYKTQMRPIRINVVTKSGVLLPGSFYRITQVDTNGYNTINLDFNSDPRFYGIYQSLAYRSSIASSAPWVSEWCNSLSNIKSYQFNGALFNGTFNFNNVSKIDQYAFAEPNAGQGVGGGNFIFNFPSLTSLSFAAFYFNRAIRGFYANQLSVIESKAFQSCMSLTTISFPECTTIKSYAFFNCYGLATASFPECTTIHDYAFYNCFKLTTISFPKCTTISSYAFQNCSSLTTISFPECTTIKGYAFSGCSNLTTVSFPKCTTINSYAFQNCTALQEVYFPECTIIYGQYVFKSCTSLSVISFPKLTTISAYAFQDCINLQSAYFMGSSIPGIGAGLFQSTPMSNSSYLGYFGSIYVPASLLASYKTATNWTAYSARMVGI